MTGLYKSAFSRRCLATSAALGMLLPVASLLLVGQLILTVAPAEPPDPAIICKRLANTFNSINAIMPMSVEFGAGTVANIDYPSGKILLDSKAREIDGCDVYSIADASTVIAHLEVLENFRIQFSEFMINNEPWEVEVLVSGCHAVLHYHVSEVAGGDGRNVLQMDALMGEIKELGNVTLRSNNTIYDGRDFTKEAEDLMRPQLLEAFNSFAKSELRWTVDPADRDLSKDGFQSFKVIFKRLMLDVDNAHRSV